MLLVLVLVASLVGLGSVLDGCVHKLGILCAGVHIIRACYSGSILGPLNFGNFHSGALHGFISFAALLPAKNQCMKKPVCISTIYFRHGHVQHEALHWSTKESQVVETPYASMVLCVCVCKDRIVGHRRRKCSNPEAQPNPTHVSQGQSSLQMDCIEVIIGALGCM